MAADVIDRRLPLAIGVVGRRVDLYRASRDRSPVMSVRVVHLDEQRVARSLVGGVVTGRDDDRSVSMRQLDAMPTNAQPLAKAKRAA